MPTVANARIVANCGPAGAKKSAPNTSPAALAYRKKSYHSMVVPITVAKATRRSSCGRVAAWNSVPDVAVMAGFDSSVGPRMGGCRPGCRGAGSETIVYDFRYQM